MIADMLSVYPYIGIHIDPVKLQVGDFITGRSVQGKIFTVPSRTANGKSGACFTHRTAGKRTDQTIRILVGKLFDAPVMGKVQASPSGIIKIGILGIRGIRFDKYYTNLCFFYTNFLDVKILYKKYSGSYNLNTLWQTIWIPLLDKNIILA